MEPNGGSWQSFMKGTNGHKNKNKQKLAEMRM